MYDIACGFDLPGQDTFGRFPGLFPGRRDGGYRPPALGHRNRASLFRDFVEQSQTFGFELGSADDCGVHEFHHTLLCGQMTSGLLSPASPAWFRRPDRAIQSAAIAVYPRASGSRRNSSTVNRIFRPQLGYCHVLPGRFC